MFDIGWTELLVVATVAILVVGPKDLPRMLRSFGRTMGQVRRMSNDFKRQFDQALREAERESGLEETRKDLQAMTKVADPLKDARKSLNEAMKPISTGKVGETSAAKPADTAAAASSGEAAAPTGTAMAETAAAETAQAPAAETAEAPAAKTADAPAAKPAAKPAVKPVETPAAKPSPSPAPETATAGLREAEPVKSAATGPGSGRA